MRKHIGWGIICALTVCTAILTACCLNCAANVMAETELTTNSHTIVIDAGHGGVDGGATSCTGKLESSFNLEIALRLEDFLQFLGYRTKMIRTTDCSVYTQGNTIASKKVSDLQQRVLSVNSTPNAILISIHQNYFSDGRYSGPVVLYADNNVSHVLAQTLQDSFLKALKPESSRQCAAAKGIYLLKHIQCPGILVECGFLSNAEEEAKLRDPAYQKKMIGIIGCAAGSCLSGQKIT